jgi:hypothetical protein
VDPAQQVPQSISVELPTSHGPVFQTVQPPQIPTVNKDIIALWAVLARLFVILS